MSNNVAMDYIRDYFVRLTSLYLNLPYASSYRRLLRPIHSTSIVSR